MELVSAIVALSPSSSKSKFSSEKTCYNTYLSFSSVSGSDFFLSNPSTSLNKGLTTFKLVTKLDNSCIYSS